MLNVANRNWNILAHFAGRSHNAGISGNSPFKLMCVFYWLDITELVQEPFYIIIIIDGLICMSVLMKTAYHFFSNFSNKSS